MTIEFLDAINEGDIAEEDDIDDEDATEDAGPSPAVPLAWYGCLWFFIAADLFFYLVLILYAFLSGMPALG